MFSEESASIEGYEKTKTVINQFGLSMVIKSGGICYVSSQRNASNDLGLGMSGALFQGLDWIMKRQFPCINNIWRFDSMMSRAAACFV